MEPETRRSQILDAALETFAARGYHATRVSDIIERAGVARGTFYLYFESKRQVFEALVDETFARIEGCIERVDVTSDVPPIEQIRANLDRVFGLLWEQRALTRLLLSEAVGLDADLDRKLIGFYDDVARLVERSLALGHTLGLLRPVDTPVLARALIGSVKEVFYQMVVGGATYDRERLIDALLDLALHGLGHD